MTYKEAYNFFFERVDFEKRKSINYNPINFSLQKSSDLLKELGNPEKALQIIHIAGTNGKGSTALYLEQFLLASNENCGTFSSPHIEKVNERIRINGRNITDNELISLVQYMKKLLKDYNDYTAFELLFGAALLFFKQHKTNFVILETGVGGKLDSTNVVTPIITIITKIGLDHQDLLGDTISEITNEKAGIIKNGIPCILQHQEKQVETIIEKKCREKNAPLHLNSHTDMSNFKGINNALMPGDAQIDNFLVAASAHSLLNLKLNKKELHKNISKNHLSGRIEIITTPKFKVILDGGHNVSALESLANFIKPLKKRVVSIVAMMSNKDIKKNMDIINQFSNLLIITKTDFRRSATIDEIQPYALKNFLTTNTVKESLKLAFHNLNNNDLLVITGSFYLIGEVKQFNFF